MRQSFNLYLLFTVQIWMGLWGSQIVLANPSHDALTDDEENGNGITDFVSSPSSLQLGPTTQKKQDEPLFHFSEQDQLYKMLQRNLEAARNLREFLETKEKKPGKNYSYWVYQKGRDGRYYYFRVDPTKRGGIGNPQEQLNGALRELEKRVSDLKSHQNVEASDQVLINQVVTQVERITSSGMKRVEDAVIQSGIVVPPQVKTPDSNEAPKKPGIGAKVSEALKKTEEDLSISPFSLPAREKKILITDYPKIKEADRHFEDLKSVTAELEQIDEKLSGKTLPFQERLKLTKKRKEKYSEFLKVYSDFSHLKDYHSAQVESEVGKFETKFKKLLDQGSKKTVQSEEVETPKVVNSNQKPSDTKDKARNEIDGVRSNIIRAISNTGSVGKEAELHYRETLERLKSLEEALNLSDDLEQNSNPNPNENVSLGQGAQDTDSRWISSLSNSNPVSPVQENRNNLPVESSNPKKADETTMGQASSNKVGESRNEKRAFVDSLAHSGNGTIDRVSSFDTGSDLTKNMGEGIVSDGDAAQMRRRSAKKISQETTTDFGNEELAVKGTPLKRGMASVNSEDSYDSEEAVSDPSLSMVSRGLNEFKRFVSGFSSSDKNSQSSVYVSNKNNETMRTSGSSPETSSLEVPKNKDANSLETKDLQPENDELGYSLRGVDGKKRGSRGASARANKEGKENVTPSVAYLTSNVTYSPGSTVNTPESIAKTNKVETQYMRNSDGTWSPISGKNVKPTPDRKGDGIELFEKNKANFESSPDADLAKVSKEIASEEGLEGIEGTVADETQGKGLLNDLGIKPAMDSITGFITQLYEDSKSPEKTDLSDKIAQAEAKRVGKPSQKVRSEVGIKSAQKKSANPLGEIQSGQVGTANFSLLGKIKAWLGLN